jgi:hypothetical protein
VTPCSLVDVHKQFEEMYSACLQGRRVSQIWKMERDSPEWTSWSKENLRETVNLERAIFCQSTEMGDGSFAMTWVLLCATVASCNDPAYSVVLGWPSPSVIANFFMEKMAPIRFSAGSTTLLTPWLFGLMDQRCWRAALDSWIVPLEHQVYYGGGKRHHIS